MKKRDVFENGNDDDDDDDLYTLMSHQRNERNCLPNENTNFNFFSLLFVFVQMLVNLAASHAFF